tara:strand:- start:189 stop:629 length:441 start_codon:yes stop_codon:yes gene_type:complete
VCFVYYTLTGNVVIAAMTQEDCVDATKLIMALFFKVRPQDFLAKERLQKEQSERVYEGLVNGVTEAKDRLLIAAKVGGECFFCSLTVCPYELCFFQGKSWESRRCPCRGANDSEPRSWSPRRRVTSRTSPTSPWRRTKASEASGGR